MIRVMINNLQGTYRLQMGRVAPNQVIQYMINTNATVFDITLLPKFRSAHQRVISNGALMVLGNLCMKDLGKVLFNGQCISYIPL